jgi:hydroxymethylbilane synthase
VRIEIIHTSGDRLADRPLAAIGGQGVFVKEIEEALLAGTIDLAVHSLKDLPTRQPLGLTVACVPEREDPRDLLAAPGSPPLLTLRPGAVVGTGSPRRACQIRALRADLVIKDLRGNVDTRVAKLQRGEYDAVILACAGVRRLGLSVEGAVLDFDQMLPAVGQGALAIEARTDDRDTAAVVGPLHHPATAATVAAERAFLRGLGGGCQAPIAAIAEPHGDRILLRGLVGGPSGGRVLRGAREGPASEPEATGQALADDLLAQGAAHLMEGAGAPPAEPH